MKKKILSIFFALVLVLSFSLVTAPAPVMANGETTTWICDKTVKGVTEVSTGAALGIGYLQVADGRVVWKDISDGIHMANLDGSGAVPINLDSTYNLLPTTSDGKATWYGKPTGESYSQIFYYDGSSTIQLTSAASNQQAPVIEGDCLIYVADAGDGGLYLWYIASSSEGNLPGEQLTEEIVLHLSHDIPNGYVYWTEAPNYITVGGANPYTTAKGYDENNMPPDCETNVVLYDGSEPETILSFDPVWSTGAGGYWFSSNPAVFLSGDYVAYSEDGIHLYSISEETDIKISDSGSFSDIGYGKVTWDGGNEIFVYDIDSGVTSQITDNVFVDYYPRLGDGFVVWIQKGGAELGYESKIKAYDFDTGKTYLFSNLDGVGTSDSIGNSMTPSIDGTDMAWAVAAGSYSSEDRRVYTADFSTDPFGIQDYINAAQSGDTINVAAGEYNENVVIPAGKDNLQLLGAGMVDTLLSPASGTAIKVNSPVTIKGFHISQTGTTAIHIMKGSSPVSGTLEKPGVIEANKIEASSADEGKGICFKDYRSEYWEIKDNEFIDCHTGIYFCSISHILVSGNTFSGGFASCGGTEGTDFITISGNQFLGSNVAGCEGIGIGLGAKNLTIKENTITGYTAGIRVYGSADLTEISVHSNTIDGNTLGIDASAGAAETTLDATNNWWGSASGPTHATNPNGTGATVSGNVAYNPWLLQPKDVSQTYYDHTLALQDGWNLISTPKILESNVLSELIVGETTVFYTYDNNKWDTKDSIEPLDALFVKMNGAGGIGFQWTTDEMVAPPTKQLEESWNLVGPSVNLPTELFVLVDEALDSVSGSWSTVYSPALNKVAWTVTTATAGTDMLPYKGYWIYMTAADELAGRTI